MALSSATAFFNDSSFSFVIIYPFCVERKKKEPGKVADWFLFNLTD